MDDDDNPRFSTKQKAGLGIGVAVLILILIIVIVFVSLHFTCKWSLFNTTQCLCEKHGGTWDDNKSPKCTIDAVVTKKCSQICQNGGVQQSDCSCVCSAANGWTGEYCQIQIPPPKQGCTTSCQNGGLQQIDCSCQCNYAKWNGSLCEIPVISPGPPPLPDTLPVDEPIIKATFPTSGTYMIKAPGKNLFLKTVGGSSVGNNQKLDDCKGNPTVCQWTFIPVNSSTANVYNIKASDADLYLRSGAGVMWLAGATWLTDPSTQFVLSYGDMTNSLYIRPITSAAKYVAVKGDWDQDDVPAIRSCLPSQNTVGCQWELVKV
jgi:hypothetical protein